MVHGAWRMVCNVLYLDDVVWALVEEEGLLAHHQQRVHLWMDPTDI
jgi:hypothetical protein